MLCNQLSVEHCALPRFPVSKEDFHDCSLLMLVIELLKFLQFFGTQEAIEAGLMIGRWRFSHYLAQRRS